MDVSQAIRERRSIRSFKRKRIQRTDLEELVDGARLAPSAANLQPLKYLVVDEAPARKKVFSALRWAAYIAPGGDPPPGCRPAAYVIVLADKRIRETNYQWEVGAAVENILLGAEEKGIGGCWLLSVDRPRLKKGLSVPDYFFIDSVVALGYPDERPRTAKPRRGSIKYYKDRQGVLRVPKRKLEELLFWNSF